MNAEQERRRTERERRAFEELGRTQTKEVVDDFENPHETALRYLRMEQMNAKILQEKARDAEEGQQAAQKEQSKERDRTERG